MIDLTSNVNVARLGKTLANQDQYLSGKSCKSISIIIGKIIQIDIYWENHTD